MLGMETPVPLFLSQEEGGHGWGTVSSSVYLSVPLWLGHCRGLIHYTSSVICFLLSPFLSWPEEVISFLSFALGTFSWLVPVTSWLAQSFVWPSKALVQLLNMLVALPFLWLFPKSCLQCKIHINILICWSYIDRSISNRNTQGSGLSSFMLFSLAQNL